MRLKPLCFFGKAYDISELVRSEKGIMIAEKIVKRMSEADDNWYVQNSLYKAECDRNSIEYYAEKKGHEEGLQQGLEQGAQQKAEEAAINLLKMGKLSLEEIAQAQGLTLKKVQELKDKINHKPA